MSDQDLQASETPARAALIAPPQPELLAVSNVGAPVTKVNVARPTGTAVVAVRPRS